MLHSLRHLLGSDTCQERFDTRRKWLSVWILPANMCKHIKMDLETASNHGQDIHTPVFDDAESNRGGISAKFRWRTVILQCQTDLTQKNQHFDFVTHLQGGVEHTYPRFHMWRTRWWRNFCEISSSDDRFSVGSSLSSTVLLRVELTWWAPSVMNSTLESLLWNLLNTP